MRLATLVLLIGTALAGFALVGPGEAQTHEHPQTQAAPATATAAGPDLADALPRRDADPAAKPMAMGCGMSGGHGKEMGKGCCGGKEGGKAAEMGCGMSGGHGKGMGKGCCGGGSSSSAAGLEATVAELLKIQGALAAKATGTESAKELETIKVRLALLDKELHASAPHQAGHGGGCGMHGGAPAAEQNAGAAPAPAHQH